MVMFELNFMNFDLENINYFRSCVSNELKNVKAIKQGKKKFAAFLFSCVHFVSHLYIYNRVTFWETIRLFDTNSMLLNKFKFKNFNMNNNYVVFCVDTIIIRTVSVFDL